VLTVNQLIGFGVEPSSAVVVFADFDEFMGQFVQFPNVSDDFWASGWIWRPSYISIQGSDYFESYEEGEGLDTDLSDGLGLEGNWTRKQNNVFLQAFDNMSSYPLGVSANGVLDGGDPNGFSTGWFEVDNA
jgi:hypothetical protein